jgi:hypothetical protein
MRRPEVEHWSTFGVIAGTAAGSLIGLPFVAVSIRISVIAASSTLRNQTAQTLGLFVTVSIVAALLSIPARSIRVLGVEVVALAALAATLIARAARLARPAAATAYISPRPIPGAGAAWAPTGWWRAGGSGLPCPEPPVAAVSRT